MTIVTRNSLTLSNVNDGTITHTAYAYSADGTDRFTTVYPNLNLGDNTKKFTNAEGGNNLNGSIRIDQLTQKTQDGDFNYLTYKSTKDNSDWFRFYLIPEIAATNMTKVTVIPNTKYTFSALLKGTGQHTIYAYNSWTATNTPWSLQINLTSDWNLYTFTVTSKDVIPNSGVQFFIRSNNGTEINLKKPKIEQGSIATPWMPSSSEVTTADWPSYIGQYSDFTATASTDPAKYAPWTVFKGNDGNNGRGIVSSEQKYQLTQTSAKPVDSWDNSVWQTTQPTTTATNKYLWSITRTTFNLAPLTQDIVEQKAVYGDKGTDGDPGKIVSDTEPTTRFKGLTWKYSGTADLTASDGTIILSGTEYYWSGTNWILSEINAHNINGNNLKITDGEFVSTIIDGPVQIQTEIKDDHLLIYKMDTSHNEIHTIALKSDSGLVMTYQNSDTGEYTSAGVNFQGLFMQNNITNEFARLTPQGTKLSTDVPWTDITRASGVGTSGTLRARINNGVFYAQSKDVTIPSIAPNSIITIGTMSSKFSGVSGFDALGLLYSPGQLSVASVTVSNSGDINIGNPNSTTMSGKVIQFSINIPLG